MTGKSFVPHLLVSRKHPPDSGMRQRIGALHSGEAVAEIERSTSLVYVAQPDEDLCEVRSVLSQS
jgi:hypothetical protein